MTESPSVLVILVNWNGSSDTIDCLASLNKLDYPNFEVVVIDNASNDNSTDIISLNYPHIQLIRNEENLGFVGGNNIGLNIAIQGKYDFALLLNNDTIVAPDFLSKLVKFASSDRQIGVVGPSIFYFDRPEVLWSGGGKINRKLGQTSMIGIGERPENLPNRSPYPVDFVTGCALLIKIPVVEQIGKLDARFFAYYEEIEWCVRVWRAGYRIYQIPEAKVWHKISIEAREASPTVVYYMTRNRLLFLKSTKANLLSWCSTGFEFTRTLVSWTIKPKWKHKHSQRKAMLSGILDFFNRNFGKRTSL